MAHRLGRLVGIACLVLVVARLGRVLTQGQEAADWRLIAGAACLVGALLTWAALTYRLSTFTTILLHLTGQMLLVLRVTAAPTLQNGILPGPETAAVLAAEMAYAGEMLRFGAPPVLAVPGLVALVGIAMWLLGSAWALGAQSGRMWLGIAPPLGFYLYLAVMDRAPGGPVWSVAFALLTALGLLATSEVNRSGSGRVRDAANRPLPRRKVGASAVVVALVVVGGLVGAAALGSDIPLAGTISWRNPGGDTTGDGVAFNPFVGLRQSLVSRSDDPVFFAQVDGPDEPTGPMYWKLYTLEQFDGTFWRAADQEFRPVDGTTIFEDPALAYRGPTQSVAQIVEIASLRQDRLPALYSPTAIRSNDDVVDSGAQVADDGSLRIQGITFDGLQYQVSSEVPVLDLGALASEQGELTPLFEAAAEGGEFEISPSGQPAGLRPDQIESYLRLPPLDPAIRATALEVTADAASAVEAALLLEDFFSDFEYSTDVSTGHSSLDLAEWLTVPGSPNYRQGYCEQFATAMAAMGRLLGLPTRVVMGFTHGDRTDSGLTIVRQRHSHAWVEVWFDQAGWVPFDPTPRGDGTTRPTAVAFGFDPGEVGAADATPGGVNPTDQPGFADDLPNFPGGPVPTGVTGTGPSAWRWLALATLTGAAVAAIPVLKALRRRSRRRRAEADDITAVWDEITDRLSDLGEAPAPQVTPLEYASATDRSLVPLAHAYSAALYGDLPVTGAIRHLDTAESWIDSHFERSRRVRAAFSLNSVRRRS